MPEFYNIIGLLDHMGFGNMGDAAIHESFIENIRKRVPSVRLVAFSENPNDTSSRHNIRCYPIQWNYPGCWTSSAGVAPADASPVFRLKSLLKRRLNYLYLLAQYIRNAGRRIGHLRRTYYRVKSLDLLVIAGGGQLCELWGGSWSHPYNVCMFCALAKLSRTPVIIVGVGAGFAGTLGKQILREVVSPPGRLHFVSFP